MEFEFINKFLIKLLEHQGFENQQLNKAIKVEGRTVLRPDIIANKNGKTFIIDFKFYRNLYANTLSLNKVLSRIAYSEEILKESNIYENYKFLIIMLCKVDKKVKEEVLKKYNFVLWDIDNLIYLCEDNKILYNLLMASMPYSITGIKPEKPIDTEYKESDNIIIEAPTCFTKKYKECLANCTTGNTNNSAKEYEKICNEIIKYLFETEFFKISEEHKTENQMFRMDLLCSLKGTTEFWKFLIKFYKTKFVVFEYKNYSELISQNLIYITEKYLFPVALRNVAFIISRKGFDSNAEKAAIGCLRENGKLIINLTDNDLINMINIKENGEEPSDYLLDKVEKMLMSVSK